MNSFCDDAVAIVDQYQASIAEDFSGIPEVRIWERPVPGQVSAANMMLHLTGNLRHFFGHVVAGSSYQRERDREFLDEPYATRDEILALWAAACEETKTTLRSLDGEALAGAAPLDSWPGGESLQLYSMRLLAHLTYHAGQIRTHYRMFLELDPIERDVGRAGEVVGSCVHVEDKAVESGPDSGP